MFRRPGLLAHLKTGGWTAFVVQAAHGIGVSQGRAAQGMRQVAFGLRLSIACEADF